MTTVDLSSYKKLYLQTAKQYSDIISKSYIKILRNSLDKDALKNMYISAHSLKSQSQAMGYVKMTALSGIIEKTIKNILANNTQIPNDLMVVIKDAIENVKLSLRNIQTENKEKDTDVISKKLEEYIRRL
ncbi:MAG: Hpt domain-containing protein [Patescibacteria group bacterium]